MMGAMNSFSTSGRYKDDHALMLQLNEHYLSFEDNRVLLTAAGWKTAHEVVEGDLVYSMKPVMSGSGTARDGSQAGAPKYDEVLVTSCKLVSLDRLTALPTLGQHGFVMAHAVAIGEDATDASSSATTPATTDTVLRMYQQGPSERATSSGGAPLPYTIPFSETKVATPTTLGGCPAGKAYLLRPPEGMCGFGNQITAVFPPRVTSDSYGRLSVYWECCASKGLADNQMMPSHHSNKSVSPLDCPVIALVDTTV